MIDARDYHNVRIWLEGSQRPLLVTHRRPDGDALGAITGLALALRDLGREPLAVLYEPFPARYRLLEDSVAWHRWDESRAALVARCDAVVIVDTCAFSQLDPLTEFLPTAPRTLVIDHHPTRDPLALRPGDLRLIDESAAAVSLLIAEWIKTVGLPLSAPAATALFAGLATDCGWFRFSNTDARALYMAAQLIEAGAAASDLYGAIYEQDSPARLRLIGRMLQSLQLLADNRLAVLTLRQADFDAVGATRQMTEDLVNEAGRLGCTEATLLFTEEPGVVRVNLRSKRVLDVAALASRFGGGGHARAAGARVTGDWDEAVCRVIDATVEALNAALRT